jgi:hypothetical protein
MDDYDAIVPGMRIVEEAICSELESMIYHAVENFAPLLYSLPKLRK